MSALGSLHNVETLLRSVQLNTIQVVVLNSAVIASLSLVDGRRAHLWTTYPYAVALGKEEANIRVGIAVGILEALHLRLTLCLTSSGVEVEHALLGREVTLLACSTDSPRKHFNRFFERPFPHGFGLFFSFCDCIRRNMMLYCFMIPGFAVCSHVRRNDVSIIVPNRSGAES